jgi:ethanolamine utilization protein EutL
MYGYGALKAKVLAVRVIPKVELSLRKELKLSEEHLSLGMLTLTSDDVGYAAVDEATKKADVRVVYARSFYAGASHSSGPLSGEFIGMLSGPSPEEVDSGLRSAVTFAENDACFWSADREGGTAFFAQCISSTGSYLSEANGLAAGSPLAYLIAPPLEAMYALDSALKAANVRMTSFFGPPSETNFAGAHLTGTQADCQAACDAFAEAVIQVAASPMPW